MNILITGINGFVGSNFTESWKNNHTLYGLDINQTRKEGVEKTFMWKELNDIPKVDAIVHLAGKAHDTKNKSKAESYFQINTELTKVIFDYFLQSDAQTFVYFSSVKAAADTVEGDILTEEVSPNPIGPYGESKIKAEEYIQSKQLTVDRLKKRVFILRPCMIHGPGNKGNLNLLYSVVSRGIPWPLGAFDNKRSFCSIENITYVVEQLIVNTSVESGIYNVCDDHTLSTNELVELISNSVNKKPRIWKFSKRMINTGATVGGLLHLPLNKDRLKKLTENYVVSNKKIKKALGIEHMPISAVEGMRKTLKSFKQNK